MTRSDLAVAVHSIFASINSDCNMFYDVLRSDDEHFWHGCFYEAGFIDLQTQDLKSIRTLRSMPIDHLFRHVKAILYGLSIYLEEGFYGFSGMESAVSDLTVDTSKSELYTLLGWFNGVVPEAFQPQDDGIIVKH